MLNYTVRRFVLNENEKRRKIRGMYKELGKHASTCSAMPLHDVVADRRISHIGQLYIFQMFWATFPPSWIIRKNRIERRQLSHNFDPNSFRMRKFCLLCFDSPHQKENNEWKLNHNFINLVIGHYQSIGDWQSNDGLFTDGGLTIARLQ